MSKLDEFYQRFGYTPIKSTSTVQSPGAKSQKSLLDKVKRNIELDGNADFNLSYVGDLARCTVICDSYEDVPNIIPKLKQAFPDLKGYISRCPNGYRGIHLNTQINGVKAEIQLCTSKAFEYGQAAEHIYTKWRSFNHKQRQQDIDKISEMLNSNEISSEERIALKDKIKSMKKDLLMDIEQKKEEYNATDELFKELHSDGSFEKMESDIEAILLSYNVNIYQNNKPLNSLLFKKFESSHNIVDIDSAEKLISKVHPIAEKAQKEMLSKLDKFLKSNKISEADTDKSTIEIIKLITKTYDKALGIKKEQAVNKDVFIDNLRNNSIQKSKIATEIAIKCKENNINFKNLNKEILSNIFKDLNESGKFNPVNSTVVSLYEIESNINDFIKSPEVVKLSKDALKELCEKEGIAAKQENVNVVDPRLEQYNNSLKNRTLDSNELSSDAPIKQND